MKLLQNKGKPASVYLKINVIFLSFSIIFVMRYISKLLLLLLLLFNDGVIKAKFSCMTALILVVKHVCYKALIACAFITLTNKLG